MVISHGRPKEKRGEDVWADGWSQRLVWMGERRVEFRIAIPARVMSWRVENIVPALIIC